MATPPKKPTDTEASASAPEQPTASPAAGASDAKPVRRKPGPKPKQATDAPAKTPAPRKPAKPRATSARSTTATGKPAATRAASPAATRKPVATRATPKASAKSNGRWGAAAIVGGIAAVGAAATAALYTLRGKTPPAPNLNPGEHAHQADGTDSSASFEAGIADEGTIPS